MRVPQRPPPRAGLDPPRDERDGTNLGLAIKREKAIRLVLPIRIAVADANPGDGVKGHSASSPQASGAHKAIRDRAREASNGSPGATSEALAILANHIEALQAEIDVAAGSAWMSFRKRRSGTSNATGIQPPRQLGQCQQPPRLLGDLLALVVLLLIVLQRTSARHARRSPSGLL
jgi:hypothetical protein